MNLGPWADRINAQNVRSLCLPADLLAQLDRAIDKAETPHDVSGKFVHSTLYQAQVMRTLLSDYERVSSHLVAAIDAANREDIPKLSRSLDACGTKLMNHARACAHNNGWTSDVLEPLSDVLAAEKIKR